MLTSPIQLFNQPTAQVNGETRVPRPRGYESTLFAYLDDGAFPPVVDTSAVPVSRLAYKDENNRVRALMVSGDLDHAITGTAYHLAAFNSANVIRDSMVHQDAAAGTLLTVDGDERVTGDLTVDGDAAVKGANLNVRNVAYTWPAASAAGFLKNDGSGGLSWTTSGIVSGSGTAGWLPVWSGTPGAASTTLGNSCIEQSINIDGTTLWGNEVTITSPYATGTWGEGGPGTPGYVAWKYARSQLNFKASFGGNPSNDDHTPYQCCQIFAFDTSTGWNQSPNGGNMGFRVRTGGQSDFTDIMYIQPYGVVSRIGSYFLYGSYTTADYVLKNDGAGRAYWGAAPGAGAVMSVAGTSPITASTTSGAVTVGCNQFTAGQDGYVVHDPAESSTNYLAGNGTWQPKDTTVIPHAITSGTAHNSGWGAGSAGQYLGGDKNWHDVPSGKTITGVVTFTNSSVSGRSILVRLTADHYGKLLLCDSSNNNTNKLRLLIDPGVMTSGYVGNILYVAGIGDAGSGYSGWDSNQLEIGVLTSINDATLKADGTGYAVDDILRLNNWLIQGSDNWPYNGGTPVAPDAYVKVTGVDSGKVTTFVSCDGSGNPTGWPGTHNYVYTSDNTTTMKSKTVLGSTCINRVGPSGATFTVTFDNHSLLNPKESSGNLTAAGLQTNGSHRTDQWAQIVITDRERPYAMTTDNAWTMNYSIDWA